MQKTSLSMKLCTMVQQQELISGLDYCFREPRDYRDQREAAEYRDVRKERERDSDQGARDQRGYERRPDYGRPERGQGPIRDYGSVPGGTQSHYPLENVASEDLR